MNRTPLEIPGYYYDKEKAKYFKIQGNTAPASAAYSSRDVKRRKTRDERIAATERDIKIQRGRVRHSKALEAPLTGGFLSRSHGFGTINYPLILAQGLYRQGRIHTPSEGPLFKLYHRPNSGSGLSDVAFAHNDTLRTRQINTYIDHPFPDVEFSRRDDLSSTSDAPERVERFGSAGDTSSMCINYNVRKVAMTWLAGTDFSGIGISPLPHIDENQMTGPSIVTGPGWARGEVSIYSSTSAPPTSPLLFAFGSSDGFLIMEKSTYSLNWASPKPEHPNHPKDVFALEFLSGNPFVLLSGSRNGVLNISDLRVPNISSSPAADVIIHPSSITHIRALNTHRIIVAGLRSSLCQYDLRFLKLDTPVALSFPPRKSKSGKKDYQARQNLQSTTPILTYPQYHNTSHLQLGFDIDVESGLIAAAMEQDDHSDNALVQLFSLKGGEALHPPQFYKSLSQQQSRQNVRCLQFVQDAENSMKSLYVGVGGEILRYAWTDREEASCWRS